MNGFNTVQHSAAMTPNLSLLHSVTAFYGLVIHYQLSSNPFVRGFHFKVFLLRHGQTDANAGGVIQGSADFSRLTDLGKQQAREAYAAFSYDTEDLKISSVYCSPLTRARQTLAELRSVDDAQPSEGAKLPSDENILANLREIDFYDWEGKDKLELQNDFSDSWSAWKAGHPSGLAVFDSSNGEEQPSVHYPLVELWERADLVWDEIFGLERQRAEENRAALIVAHGSLGQALLGSAMGWGPDQFRQHEFPNCGMIELNFSDFKARPPHADRWRWIWPTPSAKWNSPLVVMDTCHSETVCSSHESKMENLSF